MLEFLKDILIKGQILASSFKRSSDNAEVVFDNDLHSVAKSGDFNELKNKPEESIGVHGNEYHTTDFETVQGAQTKADTAETNAKDYVSDREEVLQLQLDEANLELKKAEEDLMHQKRLLMSYFIEYDINISAGMDEPGYWYSPLGTPDWETATITDSRISGISNTTKKNNNVYGSITDYDMDSRFYDTPQEKYELQN